jgi:tetrahydromethanopterin S-methyltransferase subunit F
MNVVVRLSTLVKTFLWGVITGMVFAVVLMLVCERWMK